VGWEWRVVRTVQSDRREWRVVRTVQSDRSEWRVVRTVTAATYLELAD
jgi:hypothetical protein